MWCHIISSFCLFMLIPAMTAEAQKLPMTVDLLQSTQFPKGDGPLTMVWQCSVSSTGLLEGYFLVTAHDGHEQFGQFRSRDIALQAGFHEVPMMLPPIIVDNPFSEVKLKLSFITGQQRHDFTKEYSLRVGRTFQRTFAVGVCDPFDVSLSVALRRLQNELKFEAISPPEPVDTELKKMLKANGLKDRGYFSNSLSTLDIKTFSFNVTPEKYPQLPIDCHQYDILIISARGLQSLETRHLKAIDQWVRSGGSLCVIAGEKLKTSQIQFLNNLSENENTEPFLLTSDGKLVWPLNQSIQFHRTGWGRSVILSEQTIEDDLLSEQERNHIPFFLWKLCQSQQDYYDKNHRWNLYALAEEFIAHEKQSPQSPNLYATANLFSLNYKPVQSGGAVVSNLMPEHLRVVPVWLMMMILVSYVLVIGPGEYFILGKFKLRRFTWITFPLISIGFAIIAFLLSNHFMQTSHERKALRIIDLDSSGKPVKENLIELLFTSSFQTVETKVDSGLLAALVSRQMGVNSYGYSQGVTPTLVGPPFYAGAIPTQYSVLQRMPQWTPQLNRIVKNYPAPVTDKFDWSSVRPESLSSEIARNHLKDQIETTFGKDALLFIFKGTSQGEVKRYPMNHVRNPGVSNRIQYSARYALFNPGSYSVYQNGYYERGLYNRHQHSFMEDLCIRDQNGLFKVLSQVSPSGGNNYEDLSILDPTDARQWLVIVYVPGETEHTVYRKLLFSENIVGN